MTVVAYFTAVVARNGTAWRARDVEVDDHDRLSDLAGSLRAAGTGDGPVIAVIEHEDEWFALIRVDGEDEEPTLFVSDLPAVMRSPYGPLLGSAADAGTAAEDDEPVVEDEDEEQEADQPVTGRDPVNWAGEADVLDDLGLTGTTLRKLVAERGDDPAAVLAEIGEVVGFADLLEALR